MHMSHEHGVSMSKTLSIDVSIGVSMGVSDAAKGELVGINRSG